MRPTLLAFSGAFLTFALVGCIDFSGAPCMTSATCPANQVCVSGTCQVRVGGTTQAGECEPCAENGDCGAGLTCARRSCDGKQACYKEGGVCNQISQVACPAVFNFRECTASTQCAAGSECLFGRCLQACTKPDECFIPSADLSTSIPGDCVRDSTGDRRCYPACTSGRDAVCSPLGSYCERFADQSFGYCELGCGSCSVTADCPAGLSCGSRRCDGVRGCFPADGGGCTTIALEACPEVGNFNVCTASTQCGSRSTCVSFGLVRRCLQSCTTDTECTEVVTGGKIWPARCLPASAACVVACSAAARDCPVGTTCGQAADGRFYCQ